MSKNSGKLYLIPCTLGDSNAFNVLRIQVKQLIDRLDTFVVENSKSARKFIKSITPEKQQSSLTLFELNKFTEPTALPDFLKPCIDGQDLGLLSDAGCPGIADPGADVVSLAHKHNIQVVPLVGPSSILLAMMASGFNGQSFAFNGYLPIDKSERKTELKRLERLSFEHNQTQSFIETPYRNNKLLEDLCAILNDNTEICVACDITLSTEFIKTRTVNQWKKNSVNLHKRPTLFVIHKY